MTTNRETDSVSVADCGFFESLEINLPFAETLENIKTQRLLTNFEIAQKTRNAQRTIEYWLAGKYTPEMAIQQQVLAILNDPNDPPSARQKREMERLHGLSWDSARNRWDLRVTVDAGKKVVGKRLRMKLKTKEAAVAIQVKEGVVEALTQLKLKVRQRIQKRG